MKEWKGCIIEESLENKEVLKEIKIVNTEVAEVKDATLNQPRIWHLCYVVVESERIDSVSQKINEALKSEQPWYVNFGTDEKEIVIFKNKIFRIRKNDKEGVKQIKNYGMSLGIPERQLDFDKSW